MSVCKDKSEKNLFPTEGSRYKVNDGRTDRHDLHTQRSFSLSNKRPKKKTEVN